MNSIFVYGLLKPGFSLHHVVAPFVRDAIAATARGRLYDAGVPAARFDEDGSIEGFVLHLDPERVAEALAVLDDVEDEGDQYRRIVIATDAGDAYAYEYLPALQGRRFVGVTWV